MKAPVREMFVSVQGEGPYVGYRQLFVRFPKCNLNCIYCDTPKEWENDKKCHVEKAPGSGEFEEIDNPLSVVAGDWISSPRRSAYTRYR